MRPFFCQRLRCIPDCGSISVLIFILFLSASRDSIGWASAAELPTEIRTLLNQGLELWLDPNALGPDRSASPRNAASAAAAGGGAIATWPDASQRKRDVSQPDPKFRPRVVVPMTNAPGAIAARFDGVDDRLISTQAKLALTNFTLVLVAAPHSNGGGFRALFSGNARGRNDYVTGLNLDLGAGSTGEFEMLNAEGAGFGGMRNLLHRSFGWGGFHLIHLVSDQGSGLVRLFVDGELQGERERQPGVLSLEEIRLGCRH
ncbi:MAG: hypothetical protein AB1813_09735, partial [Verrucomicrobiota bacterium]